VGTSTSYDGPRGPGDLLPPDAPPPPPDEPGDEPPPEEPLPPPDEPEDPGEEPPTDHPPTDPPPDEPRPPGPDGPMPPREPGIPRDPWAAAKNAMSRFARLGGGVAARGSRSRAVRGFVQAQGGRRRAAASGPTAVAAGRNLARFLSTVSARGIDAAARAFDLAGFLNAGVDTFLVALTRVLAPAAGTNEEAAAHVAVAETTEYLFEEYAVDEQGLDALGALTPDMVERALEHFVAVFINTRLMHVLGSRIEAGAQSAEQALALEGEVKDYVRERVSLDLGARDLMQVDWGAPESERVIQQIFEDAYGLLEVAE
jgi:hypothetical protein